MKSSADPRMTALAQELSQARGETLPFLLWSGALPDAEDELQAVNLLVGEPWWLFKGGSHDPEGDLAEIDEQWALELLTWLFGHSQACDVELMPAPEAERLARKFTDLVPRPRRWFTNGDRDDHPPEGLHPRPNPSTPLTGHTFDAGLIATHKRRAWLAWFTDED
jgi:hypothetical protein